MAVSDTLAIESYTMERGRQRAHLAVGITCVGIALAVVLMAWTGGSPHAGGDESRLSPSSSPNPAGPEYAVKFTETGLPAGTSWSVTLNGTQESSTSTTLTFTEPDGVYLFMVGPVSGYTVNPEGNVTVSGGPVDVPIVYTSTSAPAQSCSSFSWEEKNYTFHGDCTGQFETDYRWFNATSGYTFGNSTFDVVGVAEVTGSSTLDALAVPGYQGSGQMTVVYTPTAINITDVIVGNVTTVVDLNSTTYAPNGETPEWTPSEAPGGGGASFWGNGPHVLGNVTIVVVFHFDNQSGPASNLVKFDVIVEGWPWVSSSDQLGIALEATAEQGTHFAYSSSTDTIAQEWDSNGTVAASLEFGPSANATGPPSALQVSDQVGLTPSGPRPTAAVALLTFAGPGGYSGLVYDPWIVFGSGGPSVLVPPPPSAGGATLPLVAVGAIAFAASVLGLLSYRVRRQSIDEGLASPA
jgi:hypothetical protein